MKKNLVKGSIITFTDGSKGTILRELGEGGQGVVYLMNYQGRQMAFKWYKEQPSKGFISNLKNNASVGAPSDEFLWPLAVSNDEYGSVGYLMKLRPEGFYDMSQFLLNKVQFASDDALIRAALSICGAFQKLHIKGLCYFDLNDGNFFFNPKTGDALICDNDNVAPPNDNVSGIAGKARYMAPEVVLGSQPNKYSDFFSLALILFRMVFIDHPLEGRTEYSIPCMTYDAEKLIYGKKPVFIFDPVDRSNEAVYPNARNRWPFAPKMLRDAFIKAFKKENLTEEPTKRFSARDWTNLLLDFRAATTKCPVCGKTTYIEKEDKGVCKECKKPRPIYWMAIGKRTVFPLVAGQRIYESHITGNANHFDVVGEIITSKTDPTRLGIKNISKNGWVFECAQPKVVKMVAPGEAAPLIDGATLKFDTMNTIGYIRLINPA